MPWAAAGAIAGALITSSASGSASDQQAQSAANAQAQQSAEFNTTHADQQPWIQQGQTAVKALGNGTALGGWLNHTFDNTDLNSTLAPNYDFQLKQGLGAVNNSATVNSGLVGGNALKGINDYAQNYASGAYQNAFNNFQTGQTNSFNHLASIAGLGQSASNANQNAALGFSGNIASTQMAQGRAQAAGTIGSANAIAGGLNTLGGIAYINNWGGGNGNNSNGSPQNPGSSGTQYTPDYQSS